jgi:ribose-phosphate pyrophosphokinase
MRDEMRLIAGSSNRPLAEKIALHLMVPLSPADCTRFADGEVFVRLLENIRGTDVFIIQSTNPPAENLIELLLLIDAARRASAERITAVIPYYGYSRADRKDQPRVSILAKLIANMITTAGANRAMTMDLHASQIQGFFDVPSDHLYSMRVFAPFFQDAGMDNTVAVSPDIGSLKMTRAFANALRIPFAVVDKRRPEQNKTEVLNVIGDVEGKRVVLRDDMVDTGGTLVNAAQALLAVGAEEVMACCTHPVFSDDAIERVDASPITKMVVADTIDRSHITYPDKFVVLSVADVFAEAIRRTFMSESVSSLFD